MHRHSGKNSRHAWRTMAGPKGNIIFIRIKYEDENDAREMDPNEKHKPIVSSPYYFIMRRMNGYVYMAIDTRTEKTGQYMEICVCVCALCIAYIIF